MADRSDGRTASVVLRLYVAGESPMSLRALANLQALCRHHLGQHQLEVVDVLEEPLRMLRDGVVVTPTLVKVSPLPRQTLVGDLSDTDRVLQALGLKGSTGRSGGPGF